MEDRFVLNQETARALSVDTRTNILKLLSHKQYTLSDLSSLLELQNSTIKQHLDILCDAGLVKREQTKRKWKYYSLTLKGKRVVQPREITIFVSFITTLLAAFGTAFYFVQHFLHIDLARGGAQIQSALPEASDAAVMVRSLAVEETAQAASVLTIELSPLSIGLLIGTIVFTVLTFLLLGLAMKKEVTVITPPSDEKQN